MAKIFNEDSLRADIVGVWGEHGAHIDVFDHMLKKATEKKQIYITSKNTGPSWQSDPLHMIYIGSSVKEAEEAVPEPFRRHFKNLPPETRYYTAIGYASGLEYEMIQFYMADGWWYSIVMMEID